MSSKVFGVPSRGRSSKSKSPSLKRRNLSRHVVSLTRGVRQSFLSFLHKTYSTESSIWMCNNAGVTGPITSVISRNWVLKIEVFARAEWVKAGKSISTVKRWRNGYGYRLACSQRGFNSFCRWFFFFNLYTLLIMHNVISMSFDHL